MSGGWKIVKTMGSGLTRLKPRGGFCAETGAAIAIFFPTFLGLPGFHHATPSRSGSHRRSGFHPSPQSRPPGQGARNSVWAWVLTIPCAAFVAAICYVIVKIFAPAA